MQIREELKSAIERAIVGIGSDEEIKKIVLEIEADLETTQGHYARYMSILSRYKDSGATRLHIIAEGLKRAGANSTGVNSAMKILKG